MILLKKKKLVFQNQPIINMLRCGILMLVSLPGTTLQNIRFCFSAFGINIVVGIPDD